MERSPISPDDHLRSLPDDVRDDIATLDAEITAIMAGRERVLWEGVLWGGTQQRIIGYGSYRSRNRSGTEVDWFVIGLARAEATHLSLYVSAVEDGVYLVRRYANRLGKAKVGSANVTFKRVADLDHGALVEMLTKARDLTS